MVSCIETNDLPPAAFLWPPPLKYFRAKKVGRQTSPRERADTRMNLAVAEKQADTLDLLIVMA